MNRTAWSLLATIILVLVVFIALPLILPRIYSPMFDFEHRGMMGPWMMGGYGFIGVLLTLLFVVIIVIGAVWVFQSMVKEKSQKPPPTSETPLEILDRRYASGEITKEEYQEMKTELGL